MHTHFKLTETFQYRLYISKAKPQDFSEQNLQKQHLKKKIHTLFKQRLRYRGYLDNLIDKTLSEVNFRERMSALQNKQKTRKNIFPFVTEYRPSVPNPYLPTLPVFPGVSKFFMKSPGLPGRAPNLPGNTYRGLFEICLLILVISGRVFAPPPPPPTVLLGPRNKENRFLDVSRFLYSGG